LTRARSSLATCPTTSTTDQKVSFTDCVSFTLMREAGIQTAFAFDSHFERAGFKKWQ
jgi:predicted nucleic acid-binding protein